jgi:hypothetical protein
MDITKFLQNETLVWTLTTNGYKFYTLNLVRCLQALKVPWTLCIVCADRQCYRYFIGEGIPAILYKEAQRDSLPSMILFGSKAFQEINLVKLDILNTFAKNPMIERCVYLDGDIFVGADFLPDLLPRLEETPLLFQCDEYEKEACKSPCTNMCTGIIAWKHGHDGGIFKMDKKAEWVTAPEDQRWVNNKVREFTVPCATLPRNLYPNGRLSDQPPSEFLILHYNWLVGPSKQMRMRKNKHWLLPY